MSSLARKSSAIVLFTAFSILGFRTIVTHLRESGAGPIISGNFCPSPPTYQTAEQRHYTGVEGIDATLCILTSFFLASFEPSVVYYTYHFLVGILPVYTVFQMEGNRSSTPWWFSLAFIGVAFQLYGAGTVAPIAFLILVLLSKPSASSGASSSSRPSSPHLRAYLTTAQAESIIFGVTLGYILPTIWMVTTHSANATAFWQGFPVWGSLGQTLYLFVRKQTQSAKAASSSGYELIRSFLYLTGGASLLAHLVTLWTQTQHIPKDPASLIQAFINWLPEAFPQPNWAKTLAPTTIHLFKWDSVFTYGTQLLAAGYWLLEGQSWVSGAFYALIALFGSLVISPGAVISELWILREKGLNQQAKVKFLSKKKN